MTDLPASVDSALDAVSTVTVALIATGIVCVVWMVVA